ncbi:GNAT family N-acetyltransferase [Hominifimenecus sp. rT4P-3]|uniref:GNAT family N-acetyltransferase n=1 Tax=Hominifimenecus sp. rT4P-3 TaxID=3242979 RepID=UPI003DA4232D
MIRLRPYKACDAQTITTWIGDEYAFRQWSADRYDKYPITSDDMNLYYDRDRNHEWIWGMTAFDDTGIVGHFTMRFPNSSRFDEIRLGFVIIDDKKRGKGYGKEMVSLAIQYAFCFVKVKKISLGVFENNKAAIKCYESCGFKRVKLEHTESYHCMGERWNCIEMELVK